VFEVAAPLGDKNKKIVGIGLTIDVMSRAMLRLTTQSQPKPANV